jgi:hypothetical protein
LILRVQGSQSIYIESKAKYKVVSTTIEKDLFEELFEISTEKLISYKSFRNNLPYGEWYSIDKKNSKINNVVYGRLEPQGYYSSVIKIITQNATR